MILEKGGEEKALATVRCIVHAIIRTHYEYRAPP